MAVITPNTDLYLLKVPLEIDDINQLDFANATTQFNYFNSLPKIEVEDFTYQRKDGTIRFPAQYDEIVTYNYVMYRNNEYTNKWFYAFITNMEYVNDNMTMITIKTDVWQSWQFDLTYKPCLIDREHVNDDTIGLHTYPEELELGEFVINGNVTNFGGASDYYTIVEVSQVENRGESTTLSYTWASGTHDLTPSLNDIERGTIPLIVGAFAGASSGQYSTVDKVVAAYDAAGLADSIVNIYLIPRSLVGGYNEIIITGSGYGSITKVVDGLGVPIDKAGTYTLSTNNFSRPTSINGYVPKNNKMLCYPFQYFNVSNNSGTSIDYHYEDFSSSITFVTEGTFGVSGSTKTIPQNYKNIGSSNALDYSVTGPKYPVCSWKSDSYTNWLTQNGVNLNTEMNRSVLAAGLGMLGGAARGFVSEGLAGAGVGGMAGLGENAGGIVATAREQHLAKTAANFQPDQVKGNLGAGDFLWAKYKSPFTFLPMSIKAEYAHCADQFLSQYGYKCNRVKVPNIKGRRNWNYVKTIGCYIEADIPQADLAEIKGMFDKGITIWHNPTYFADYTQNNDII